MDLNPDYRGFIEHPSGRMIYEGDTLNIKKQKPVVKAISLLHDKLKEVIGLEGDAKFKETLVGELLGGGKEFKETGVGKFLGGGKPIGETAVGKTLGLDKPFKDTTIGKILGGGKPIEETGVGRFFSTEETPVLDAIFKNAGKEDWESNYTNIGPTIELVPTQKRGGGLINKYSDGGIFGDFFTNLIGDGVGDDIIGDVDSEIWEPSKFGQTKLGKWMGSEKGQEGMQSFADSLKKPEEVYETEKERLEAIANQKSIQGSDVVNYASAAGKAASGNIPGAILDVGKTYIDMFGRKKEKKKAQKELKQLEKKEDLGLFNPNKMTSDIQQQYNQSLQTDMLDSELPEDEAVTEDDIIANEISENYASKFMEKGGMVSSDAFPFLSDSYKRYLSQQYGSGGRFTRRRPEHLKYQYASGGMVKGPSHERGGVKYKVGGEVVELEGGEAVINKKSTEMFRPLLSKLNQAGGGTSFARGGLVNPNVNKMIQRLISKNR